MDLLPQKEMKELLFLLRRQVEELESVATFACGP